MYINTAFYNHILQTNIHKSGKKNKQFVYEINVLEASSAGHTDTNSNNIDSNIAASTTTSTSDHLSVPVEHLRNSVQHSMN
ncbi:hypothetical protein RO3G_01388 [Rhizopus delemar RA 99-880]|uniref:Uncharacterized protein n=1 Tax=Rhizopus delemar (strain RA 99-880 / ATCC MYA-4621 / FGSC 9543 / NRRL 43880) TaxID=246409 RepID=I1BKF4_RHIO9|nr:hypothetical protein RO3G_01388 [Rhizopus delemar RA 99-880]|eukprot:EIE76684.1 hypothetical protein RO3G_01388 [Rhizopus delemar RA 99-880]